jgi:hypothetical protein
VPTRRKLLRAGVEAELQVFERLSRAQYNFDAFAPETEGDVHRDRAVFRPASWEVRAEENTLYEGRRPRTKDHPFEEMPSAFCETC